MKKVAALALVACGGCAIALAIAQTLLAFLSVIHGDPTVGAVVRISVAIGCAWFLLVLGLRLLAEMAGRDPEARELLVAVLGVLRLVPLPEGVRRVASKAAGLGVRAI